VVSFEAPIPPAPQRIVSLVPSLTEALFVLGLGERVVGVTDWCIHPADGVASLPKLGGTKNPDLDRTLALRPDLVIANHEENTERVVRAIREAGVAVWVTYPRTAAEGAKLLREMAALGASARAVAEVVEPVERAVREARRALRKARTRFFCPIWRDPWMSIGADTFAHSMVSLCGGENVFGDRAERRYPLVSLEEVVAAQPEVILLPDEPYAFGDADREELLGLEIPAARDRRIHLVDGTAVSWYGPRIRHALETLRPLLRDRVRAA
jgi:ABC-type Fe3+-hydroxamate transport system substrate-binding protein